MQPKIEVGGLQALSKALKAVDSDAPKQLRLALNDAAALLVDQTRPLVPSRSGAARRSLVARSTRTSARVAIGGKRAPYVPWLDFGGRGPGGRPARRPFLKQGRYVYPTLIRIRPRIEQRLSEGISTLVRDAGLTEE